jgi:hypothetical protein
VKVSVLQKNGNPSFLRLYARCIRKGRIHTQAVGGHVMYIHRLHKDRLRTYVSCRRACHIHPQDVGGQVAGLRKSFEEEWLVELQQGLMVQHNFYRM